MSLVLSNGLATNVEVLDPADPVRRDTLRALRAGGVPTLVMLHGLGSDTLASWYLTLAHPLRDAGARVVLYDLRGHGRTERPRGGYRLDDFIGDLSGVLSTVDVEGPVYLLGNSFGGTVAYGYAAAYPERVAGIAAIESAPPTAEWRDWLVRRLQRAERELPRDQVLAQIGARRGERVARWAQATRDLVAETTVVPDLTASSLPTGAQLAAVTCPVLAVYGGDSELTRFAPTVSRLLPRARVVVVTGQRHMLLIDRPTHVLELVESWLEQSAVAGPARAEAH
jgi:pimeloyl-ACP methyl ester carboxylesterase